MSKSRKIEYRCVLLDKESHERLLSLLSPDDKWTLYAHHMTITHAKDKDIEAQEQADACIGQTVELTVTELGLSSEAIALKVSGYPYKCSKPIPHITLCAVVGVCPFASNAITRWEALKEPFVVRGVVTAIKYGEVVPNA